MLAQTVFVSDFMAFNCTIPGVSYNGFGIDDLSANLSGMSKSDLEKLLNNPEAIKEMTKNSSQVVLFDFQTMWFFSAGEEINRR